MTASHPSAPPGSAPASPPSATIGVEVAYSPGPGEVLTVALRLPTGSTLADALEASGFVHRYGLDPATLRAGVWCRPQEGTTALRDRDRVEIYRGLRVDPKEARRQRYKRHLENLAAKARRPRADEGGG